MSNDWTGPAMVVGVVVLFAFALFLAGYGKAMSRMRQEAVEHGAAEWHVTDTDGTTEFRWRGED